MYNKIIQSIEKIMDVVARYTLAVAFSVIFIIGLFIKAMYSFDDSLTSQHLPYLIFYLSQLLY